MWSKTHGLSVQEKNKSLDSAVVPFSIRLTMDSYGTNSEFASVCVALIFMFV